MAAEKQRCDFFGRAPKKGEREVMTKATEAWQRAFHALQQHNLIPHHGEKAIDSAYWSEVIDPEHKPGHGRQGKVAYLVEAKRKPHIVRFDKDRLVVPATSVFKIGVSSSTAGELIWVIDRDRKFYVGIKAIGNFHHSSFLAGSQVLAAGSMVIASGYKILEVNNNSGHYKPDLAQLKLAAVVMRLQGADLNLIPFKYSPPPGKGTPVTFGSGIAMIRHDL
jgi:hypothetical protein